MCCRIVVYNDRYAPEDPDPDGQYAPDILGANYRINAAASRRFRDFNLQEATTGNSTLLQQQQPQ